MNKLNDFEPDLWKMPVNFRVIGYGEELSSVIQQIKSFGYDGLEARVVTSFREISPADDDKMVIVLAIDRHDGLVDLLRSFYQAGVLTLLITDRDINLPPDVCDSRTTVSADKFVETVKDLVTPIFNNGMINLDFNDQSITLRNTSKFVVCTADARGGDSRIADAVASFPGKIPDRKHVERMLWSITHNRKLNPPLAIKEIAPITEFIKSLPETIDIVWGVLIDDSLPGDTVRLSIIVAGKEL